jgi:hypothetical protein
MAEQTFDVRLKKYGKIIVRQGIRASSAEQACEKCKNKKGVIVLGAKKVDKSDVIGWADTFKNIKDVIGMRPDNKTGILYEDTTLDSVIFNKKFEGVNTASDSRKRYKGKYNTVRDEFDNQK